MRDAPRAQAEKDIVFGKGGGLGTGELREMWQNLTVLKIFARSW